MKLPRNIPPMWIGAGLVLAGLVLSACASTSGERAPPVARAAPPLCGESHFPIYFQPGSDQLTRESVQVINTAAQGVKGCALGPLDVVGLAGSFDGPRDQALALAQRRSLVVLAALKVAGLPAPRFDLDAVGAAGSQTRKGRREPLRRRAEVIIHAGNPSPAAR